MKLELDITIDQSDVKAVVDEYLRQSVRSAVAEKCRSWGTERDIKALVAEAFQASLGSIINEEMQNIGLLREEVRGVIKRKLQAQLTKLMKEQGANDA